jgi:hypothetical protein
LISSGTAAMNTNALTQFARLWDGSESGWVVVRHTDDLEDLTISFSDGGPTSQELRSLRAVSPAMATKQAAEVVRDLKGKRSYFLWIFESSAARRLRSQCESHGLSVLSRSYRNTHYSLINELTSKYLLIEDEATRRSVAEEAISRGLLVRESTA